MKLFTSRSLSCCCGFEFADGLIHSLKQRERQTGTYRDRDEESAIDASREIRRQSGIQEQPTVVLSWSAVILSLQHLATTLNWCMTPTELARRTCPRRFSADLLRFFRIFYRLSVDSEIMCMVIDFIDLKKSRVY